MGAPLVSGAVDINQGRSVMCSRKRSTIKWPKIYKQNQKERGARRAASTASSSSSSATKSKKEQAQAKSHLEN